MSDPTLSKAPPQFKTAEYSAQSGSDRCKFCNQTLSGSYYRVNQSMACANCEAQVRLQMPKDNPAAYTRGLLFGAGGAVVGLILYAVFGIVTGLMIGYVSLAVGWIVGKAMMKGSGGIGGRRYQIAAAVLTYAAVSMAAIPIYIAQAAKAHRPARPQQSQSLRSPAEGLSGNPAPAPEQNPPTARRRPHVGAALIILALMGLASPFLELHDPFHGLIGLVILFVGIQIAWKMTRGISLQIFGPFKLGAPMAGPPSAG